MIKEAIKKLVSRINLKYGESRTVMREIMSGECTGAQIAAFLTALRMKGETVEEIGAFAEIMRKFSKRIEPQVKGRLVDTCGTGGDRIKTFNVSTTAAFVVAGANVSIAKHGNRSVTSRSGSADVLEKLGFNLEMDFKDVKRSIEETGIGFMFAPAFHPAMKYAIGPRKEMGIRTIFNILGPLTNPACADAQVLGVYNYKLTMPIANALKGLGCKEAMVVHGLDGIDEISTFGKTAIAWLRDDEVNAIEISPRDFGVETAQIDEIRGTAPEKSAEILFEILSDHNTVDNAKLDMVLVNAAAGIIVGGKADDFSYGMELSRESIESGSAYGKLKDLIRLSGGTLARLEELELKHG